MKYVLAPSIPLLIGFGLGVASELRKEASAAEKVFLEHRMKGFIKTAEHFEAYRLNWSRLTQITAYEWGLLKKGDKLPPDAIERKRKFVVDREAATDRLFAELRTARLFFGPDVHRSIDQFMAFDDKETNKTLDKLAPISEWGKHQQIVLEAISIWLVSSGSRRWVLHISGMTLGTVP